MKYKSFITTVIILIMSPKSYAISHMEFFSQLYDNSSQIKVKKYELESEIEKSSQAKLYFLPKVRADYTTKNTIEGESTEAKISANATIFTTETGVNLDIADSQVDLSSLSLKQEEENLYRLMLENVISIKVYSELLSDAEDLKQQSIDIYNQIERNYELGLAKSSDRNQGKLLVERIQTDIESISREIELFKSNIELATGVQYPENEVTIDEKLLNYIENFESSTEGLKKNIEYQIVSIQADVAKKEIRQQYPLLDLKLISEYKFTDGERADDSHIGLQAGLNLFNYDNYSNLKSKSKLYLAAVEKAENKFKEIESKLKTTSYTRQSNIEEMKSLYDQLETTENILTNQYNEYHISQSSYYEMLNTRYDLFSTKRKIADKKISIYLNSIEMLQLNGTLINNEY